MNGLFSDLPPQAPKTKPKPAPKKAQEKIIPKCTFDLSKVRPYSIHKQGSQTTIINIP